MADGTITGRLSVKGTMSAAMSRGGSGGGGTPGPPGPAGYSPTATVTKSGNAATITITDKNGTTTATVKDGADGEDGHSPIKGTDYWTTADKAAIVQDVLDALDEAEGVSY